MNKVSSVLSSSFSCLTSVSGVLVHCSDEGVGPCGIVTLVVTRFDPFVLMKLDGETRNRDGVRHTMTWGRGNLNLTLHCWKVVKSASIAPNHSALTDTVFSEVFRKSFSTPVHSDETVTT